MDVVVPYHIDSWKFAQQKLQKFIHIGKMCSRMSQQVNETVEGLILVLKMNLYPFSRAHSDQYVVLHISEFNRLSHI